MRRLGLCANRLIVTGILWFAVAAIVSSPSFAAPPLATDDAATAGKGALVIDNGVDFSATKNTVDGVRIAHTGVEASSLFTYGVRKNVDVVTGFRYDWTRVRGGNVTAANENGLADTSVETKWVFYDKGGLSFGLKPGITLPSGNDDEGFGGGQVTYGAIFLATRVAKPLAFHLNLGYYRNENKVGGRKDLWQASSGGSWEARKGLNIVAEVFVQSNRDPTIRTAPAYALGGYSFSIGDHVTVDGAVKFGLNKREVDRSYIAGFSLNI